jgi:hypothetical protein
MKEIIQSEKRQNWEIPTDEVKTSKSIVQVASK